jgi:hypothetical protein
MIKKLLVTIPVVIALIAVTTFSGNTGFAQQGQQLTIEQKLELVKQLRAQVQAKETEVKQAKGTLKNGEMIYRITDMASDLTGWAAWITLLFGSGSLFNDPVKYAKSTTGKVFLGTLIGWAATKVMYEHYKGEIEINKVEKEKLEGELDQLNQRLLGLEAGFQSLSNIK